MTDVDVVTGEIVPLAAGLLTPGQARERAGWLREVTKAALEKDVDYGVIPGTDKPSLLKPGAEMLLLAAGLGFSITRIDDDTSRNHQGVTYRCSVHRGGLVIAECDGYAGYDESRYYRTAKESEHQERTYARRDKRPVRPERFIEYRAPWNTLVKMAQKRALVGAALNAVAGSGLFAADDDDPPPAAARPAARREEPVPDHVYDNAPESRGHGTAHNPPRYDPPDDSGRPFS